MALELLEGITISCRFTSRAMICAQCKPPQPCAAWNTPTAGRSVLAFTMGVDVSMSLVVLCLARVVCGDPSQVNKIGDESWLPAFFLAQELQRRRTYFPRCFPHARPDPGGFPRPFSNCFSPASQFPAKATFPLVFLKQRTIAKSAQNQRMQ